MRSDSLLKHLAICAVISVVFYVSVFAWIEHLRTYRGPWTVDFRADATGTPSVVISQKHLRDLETIVFPGQVVKPLNSSRTVVFAQTPPALPFGELLFQDNTFLPGTVTIRLFGHLVEFYPRAITIDRKGHAWKSGEVIEVH